MPDTTLSGCAVLLSVAPRLRSRPAGRAAIARPQEGESAATMAKEHH